MKRTGYAAGALLAASALYFFLPADCPEAAKRMAFIFAVAAFFWALEIIPLFATSILVVVLEALFLAQSGAFPGAAKNQYQVFLNPFASPIIMLFLGGFVLARAFQKYHIDQWIASHLLKIFGTRPYFVLLGFMCATGFLSMWISNTATAALMLALVRPFLSGLPHGDPFKKAVVLAIAFAAAIGGITTPVGTPPNAIAIGVLAERGIHLSFLRWMLMAVPLAILLTGVTSALLYFLFPAKERILQVHLERTGNVTWHGKVVMGAALITVLFWLTSSWHGIPEALTALLCVGFLAGFAFIDRTDLKQIEWDVLVLMWGGLALGEGMEKTGLAAWVVGLPVFAHQGFALVIVFCLLSVILSTFVSNTATVNLLIPIALSIPGEDPVMLAVVIALASSFDIALPMATPPMAIAYGTRHVSVGDMLRAGIPFTIMANVILLAGFQWMVKWVFAIR